MKATDGRRPQRRSMRVAAAAALAALAALALCAPAGAFVYWADGATDTIGRSNLDGSGVHNGLVTDARFPASLDVNDRHVYWASFAGETIGRARLDGSRVKRDLICDCFDPAGVAVHGGHVYWTAFGGSIGRADLDGGAADQEFIPLPGDSHPFGIAVDDRSVYWTRAFTETIDRAAIDGSAVELGLIELAPLGPDYIALDGEHVYWSNNVTDTIGRAKLDGSDPDPLFIPLPEGSHPYGLAVTDTHIYWADIGSTAIGRARLDGSELDAGFVELPIGALPYDVAVDAGSDTRLRGAASADRVQRRRGPVEVEVRLKAGERLTATLKGTIKARGQSYELGTRSLELADDARRSLRLRPRRRGGRRALAAALDAGRTARAKVTARLVDLAANRESERLRVRLTR